MAQKTSFYVTDEFAPVYKKYTDRYGSPSKAITNAMMSLNIIYRTERGILRQMFTQQEINLMLNNALSTAYTHDKVINRILWDTEDEVESQFEYFGVNRDVLTEKLRGLTISQQYALVDWLIEQKGGEMPEVEE